MSTLQHKNQILQLLGNAQTSEALDLLDRMLIHGRLYTDLVNYKARYREIISAEYKGILNTSEIFQEKAKFSNGLVAFVADLDEREFLNQILLLSPDPVTHAKLASNFKLYFPNTAENFSGEFQAGDFAFVVCNDFETPPDKQESFDKLMQNYLDKGFYLVCATESNTKELVGKNRKKVHAANSRFALYARVREMIDFVRYFSPASANS